MKNKQTLNLVLTAFFATLTFVGTMIRIPLPAAVGSPFIHLGNTLLLLSVLLLGYPRGAIAGGLGFAIFDILNGFAAEAPYFILESLLVGGVAWITFTLLDKKDKPRINILIVAFFTGLSKLALTFFKNFLTSLFLGAGKKVALTAAFTTLPATVINVVLTALLVVILYYPLKKILDNMYQ